jgi:GT2 family glycosyltransferase
MHPKVAIVILNWNGEKHLKTFLPSVLQSTYPNLEIIVGDNNSTDNSISFLKQNYQSVRIIINDLNYGYTGGYNRVLKQVDADYCILLNSDVEVTPNWIEPIITLMKGDKSIAAVQPKIKDYKNKEFFEYAGAGGGMLDCYGYPFCRGRIFETVEKDTQQYENNTEIFWASGTSLAVHKRLFDDIGGLDEDFFAHMEEIDLCWRFKNQGYKIMYCAESVVYHLGGGTLEYSNPKKTYLNFRNNLILLCKNLPNNQLLPILFIRLWLDLAAWFKFLFEGNFQHAFEINKAHSHFFFDLPKWLSKRYIIDNPAKLWHKSIVWSYFINKKRTFNEL